MRKFLLTAIAASVLIPSIAIAQSDDRPVRLEPWQELREANEDLFRAPDYVSPRGLPQRRVSVGDQLAMPFYGESYRIADFETYRLPRPAGSDQQYVRYGDDVLLVNVRSGRVVRVYRDFFL